jgi:hypothetical protein
MLRSTATDNIQEGEVTLSSAQDENTTATRKRVEAGNPRAGGQGRSLGSTALRVRLFKG